MFLKTKSLHWLYWLVPPILFGLQAVYIFNSFSQIRFEELIESIQAPLWFADHKIISGLHSNVGWYSLLFGVYELFGFTLDASKFLLLGIYGGFVLCLAVVMRRFLPVLPAAICLLTVGLSPTILFYNTESLHLAVGMQILPICILLLLSKKFFLQGLSFFLAMWAALVYPPFVFYIPSLTLFCLLRLVARGPVARSSRPTSSFRVLSELAGARRDGPPLAPPLAVLFLLFSLLLPLIFVFLWVSNREILIFDETNGSGLFRGGGRIEISEGVFSQAWGGIINDFFVKAQSYHFEVDKVDFSLGFPIVSLILALRLILGGWKSLPETRIYTKLVLLAIFLDLLIVSITSDYGIPAMKRGTPALAGMYALWIMAWWYVKKFKIKSSKLKILGMAVLSLLTFHHIVVFPINLAHIPDPSPFRDAQWFVVDQTPQKSLEAYLTKLQKEDLALDCRPFLMEYSSCSYEFIYSALAASCRFNNLDCNKIRGYDFEAGDFVPLSIEYFR